MSKMASRNTLCGCVNHLRDLHALEMPFYYWGEQGARSMLSSGDYLEGSVVSTECVFQECNSVISLGDKDSDIS